MSKLRKGCIILATLAILCLNCVLSSSEDTRKGFFIDDGDNSDEAGSRSELLKAIKTPSELACSQKCFANDQCRFKSFDMDTGRCELYSEAFAVAQKKKMLKRINSSSQCDRKPCGNRCKCVTLLGTDRYACNCYVKGLPWTSQDYVHSNCSSALETNGNASKPYFIQPSLQHGAIPVSCERGLDGKAYTLFNHDTEAEVKVTGYSAMCVAYQKTFSYQVEMDFLILMIENAQHCEQKSLAACKKAKFLEHGCTYLKGRNGTKLSYWAGGQQNGEGCACGVTKTCEISSKKCNCDGLRSYWLQDEGFVTDKNVLPLTGIAIGDTTSVDTEVLKYTIGPLRCLL